MTQKTLAEKVILAGVLFQQDLLDEEEAIGEFEALAFSAGASPVGRIFQHRKNFDPTFAIGRGKLDEILFLCHEKNVGTVLFLNDLSPVQQRNIENILERKVVDRTGLILDIFAQRARTREGKLQVELAQLSYLLPRLAGMGNLLSRLGGGIGTRGPGEQKLETDRRRIQQRIRKVEEEIERVRRHRKTLFQGRRKRELPIVSLVGYTNAGKTSLLNAMTGSKAYVAEQFFATLDPLVRSVRLSQDVSFLLTDTVGFLQSLPPQLIAAFHATLEELEEADILLHVADGSHPNCLKNIATVQEILSDLKLEEKEIIPVINKMDRISAGLREELEEAFPAAVFVSAKTGEGLEDLKQKLQNRFRIAGRLTN